MKPTKNKKRLTAELSALTNVQFEDPRLQVERIQAVLRKCRLRAARYELWRFLLSRFGLTFAKKILRGKSKRSSSQCDAAAEKLKRFLRGRHPAEIFDRAGDNALIPALDTEFARAGELGKGVQTEWLGRILFSGAVPWTVTDRERARPLFKFRELPGIIKRHPDLFAQAAKLVRRSGRPDVLASWLVTVRADEKTKAALTFFAMSEVTAAIMDAVEGDAPDFVRIQQVRIPQAKAATNIATKINPKVVPRVPQVVH